MKCTGKITESSSEVGNVTSPHFYTFVSKNVQAIYKL
jgi:hypothetical protein